MVSRRIARLAFNAVYGRENKMGFSLKYFFEELEAMVSHGASHIELLEYIEDMKKYAQECGELA